MRIFAVDFLHIFILIVLTTFVVLSILAILGRFDHWSTRFLRRYVYRIKTDPYSGRKVVTREEIPEEE